MGVNPNFDFLDLQCRNIFAALAEDNAKVPNRLGTCVHFDVRVRSSISLTRPQTIYFYNSKNMVD